MYDKILKAMEPVKDGVSFYERMVRTNDFLKRHNLEDKIFEPMPEEPLSIVWAVTMKQLEVFEYQVNSLAQFEGIFIQGDEVIVVCDEKHAEVAKTILKSVRKQLPPTTFVTIHRDQLGNRPGLNWDIGVDHAGNNRLLFLRDINMFFQPWELISRARKVEIEGTLYNYSTVFGYPFAPAADKWVYLVHSKFAPTPYLFTWSCDKRDYKAMGGFDLVFRRGYDQMSDVDFLLRWSMAEFNYVIDDDVQTFHPAVPISEEELRSMEFESAVPRKYFRDRYEDETFDFLGKLEPPYRSDIAMIKVQDALTYPEESTIETNTDGKYFCAFIKDPFTFAKLPHEKFIIETEKINE